MMTQTMTTTMTTLMAPTTSTSTSVDAVTLSETVTCGCDVGPTTTMMKTPRVRDAAGLTGTSMPADSCPSQARVMRLMSVMMMTQSTTCVTTTTNQSTLILMKMQTSVTTTTMMMNDHRREHAHLIRLTEPTVTVVTEGCRRVDCRDYASCDRAGSGWLIDRDVDFVDLVIQTVTVNATQ